MRLKADIKTNGQSFSLVTLILLTFGQIPGKVEPDICPREAEKRGVREESLLLTNEDGKSCFTGKLSS